jgi:DNA-nicking Smr family endonuclease
MDARKSKDQDSPTGFYKPFHGLSEQIAQTGLDLSTKPCPPRIGSSLDDGTLFIQAMQEVVPLEHQGAFSVPGKPRRCQPVFPFKEDWEALCALTELVGGRGQFDLSLTDEYLEGQVPHLDPRVVRALKAGALPVQDYCDLHGLGVDEAEARLKEFLTHCLVCNYRSVLVVHGRGRNSPGQLPVLKSRLEGWLTMKRFRRQVLAFASARPYDGGTGALYLLLRRHYQPLGKKDKP